MEKEKKLKIYLGLIYILIITLFLWFFLSKFSISEISSYDFIKNNRDLLIGFKESNLFFVSIIFFFFTIIWVLLLGFGTPVALLAGFIFGKWLGTLILLIALSVGSTILYILANYFLKEIIIEKFSKKFGSLKSKFEKNEFLFFLIYRFIGGIPFFISNILPTLFEVKVKNFFFGTFLGTMPQLFIWVSLGNGLEEVIDKNIVAPNLLEIFKEPEVYIPILGFVVLLIIGIFLRKKIYKN